MLTIARNDFPQPQTRQGHANADKTPNVAMHGAGWLGVRILLSSEYLEFTGRKRGNSAGHSWPPADP
jgi:hypothetical protein